jgi:hypothetical protein
MGGCEAVTGGGTAIASLQNPVLTLFRGRGQDRAAPSFLGVLPNELHLTCFPQGN